MEVAHCVGDRLTDGRDGVGARLKEGGEVALYPLRDFREFQMRCGHVLQLLVPVIRYVSHPTQCVVEIEGEDGKRPSIALVEEVPGYVRKTKFAVEAEGVVRLSGDFRGGE